MKYMIKQIIRVLSAGISVLIMASVCAAAGGKVTYPNGNPVVGASVKVMKDEKEKLELTTDNQGKFSLPDKKFNKATVQITAPDGKPFAPVTLPVEMFQGNDLAIVLQPSK